MSPEHSSSSAERPPEGHDPELPVVPSTLLERLSGLHAALTLSEAPLRGESARSLASEQLGRLRAEGEGPRLRYVIEGEVGRGGMGAVFEIFDVELRRRLAMKVALPPESGARRDRSEVDPGQLLRFLEEAQITGQLDHPGVVPVHELGVDGAGRVYFTMRIVRGQELSQVIGKVHAGDADWTRTRALGALLKVCEAMSYAHDKGVVHRDLKPANVMVGQHGEVYVMDWGLARVEGRSDTHDVRPRAHGAALSEVRTDRREAAQREADSPILTMDGSVLGTPYYMPPEQAAGKLEEIGPRSDVYALGAMLYHLLTGHMPYHREGERPSPHTVLAMVMQGPPESIQRLVPGVPAELEAICERAMARDPRDRYPDMGALAEDLRAYLEDRVVQAHRTGAVVELRKWVQRNRALAVSLAALVVLVAGGSATAAAVLGVKNKEVRSARDESERVTRFLEGQFEALEPESTLGRALSVEEFLARAARSLDQELGARSVEGARLSGVVGNGFQSLGLYAAAEPLLERAWNERRELLGEGHPDTLTSQHDLAVLYENQGRFAEAEPLHVEALERRRAVLGDDHPDTLGSMSDLAFLYESQGREAQAESLYVRVLERRRAVLGEEHVDTLVSLGDLALLYEAQGRLEEAEPLLERAFETSLAARGADHPETLFAQSNLALLYGSQGREEDAEAIYVHVLERSRAVLGEEHPDTLSTLNNLALFLDEQDRGAEAEPLYHEVLGKSRVRLGDDHPDTLTTLQHLAELYEYEERWTEGAAAARELVERTPPDDPARPQRERLLGRLLEARDD